MHGPDVVLLLIGAGIRASVPVGIARLLIHLTPRSSAAIRHSTWACAISIAALLPILATVTPRWSLIPPAPVARLASTARIGTSPSTVPNVNTLGQVGKNSAQIQRGRQPVELTPWKIAVWIWITGVALVSSYILVGHCGAWRLYRTTRRMQSSWMPDAEQLLRGSRR